MGSADWMPRNLDKRVEILFPVEDDALKAEVTIFWTFNWRITKKQEFYRKTEPIDVLQRAVTLNSTHRNTSVKKQSVRKKNVKSKIKIRIRLTSPFCSGRDK